MAMTTNNTHSEALGLLLLSHTSSSLSSFFLFSLFFHTVESIPNPNGCGGSRRASRGLLIIESIADGLKGVNCFCVKVCQSNMLLSI